MEGQLTIFPNYKVKKKVGSSLVADGKSDFQVAFRLFFLQHPIKILGIDTTQVMVFYITNF